MTRLVLPGSLARAVVAQPPAPRVPFRATVASLSGGLVTVTPVGSDTAGALTLARLAGPVLAVGDEVLIDPAGTGWIVAGKIQRSDTGAVFDTPLHVRKSQAVADTASTTNTATFVDALSANITLPAGTWEVLVAGGVNLAHSASDQVDRRTTLGATNGTTQGAMMLTSSEHYPVDDVYPGVAGNQTLAARVQYKGSTGTSGTSSARCPYLDIFARRTA